MSLAFRNVTATPSDPVAEWPTEAVQAALERGDFEHWQRIATEINQHPWGAIARKVEEILTHSRPFGVAELMESVISRARDRAEEAERQVVAEEIRQAIARSGLSRAEFASGIGTSATRLSTYATGRVTPSATLLVRIRQQIAGTGHQGSPRRPSGRGGRPA